MEKDNWAEFIKGVIMFNIAFLPSLYAVYLLVGKHIQAGIDKAKEKSVGETRIKQIDEQMSELIKRFEKSERGCEEMVRRLDKIEDNQDHIRTTIERNMQESINILMRGK